MVYHQRRYSSVFLGMFETYAELDEFADQICYISPHLRPLAAARDQLLDKIYLVSPEEVVFFG